jgi:hypothetical protein
MTASFLANLQRAHAAPPAAAAAHARFAGDHRLLALRNRLFADAAPLMERGMRLHVLVDPVLVDPLEDAPGRQQAVPLPLTGRHDDRTRHPYLLALGDIGRDEIIDRALDLDWAEATRHVERETRGSTVCALLACEPEHGGGRPVAGRIFAPTSRFATTTLPAALGSARRRTVDALAVRDGVTGTDRRSGSLVDPGSAR